MDVIGPVWCKHILSAIYNESLKTKFYLKPLAPIKFADAAALFICNREVLGSNPGKGTAFLSDGFRAFPHAHQTNVKVVPLIDQDRFLPHLFTFIIDCLDAIYTELTGSLLQ